MNTQSLANEMREVMYLMKKEKPFNRECECYIKRHDLMVLNGIHHMNDGKPVKMCMINQRFKISAPATSQLIRKYEKKGYISREVSEDDRRNVYVQLTDFAKEEIKAAEKQLNEDLVAFIDYLGEEDAKELIRILKKATKFKFE